MYTVNNTTLHAFKRAYIYTYIYTYNVCVKGIDVMHFNFVHAVSPIDESASKQS